MPGKMARSDPRPSVRVTLGAGSGQHLVSVLQERRENANIDAGLGFIWRISVQRWWKAKARRARNGWWKAKARRARNGWWKAKARRARNGWWKAKWRCP